MKITIFLAVYHGEKFLEKQLNSFLEQDLNLRLVVSQDCQDQASRDILEKFAEAYSSKIEVILLYGEGKGFVHNFLSMVCSDKYQSDYYAYSDQDDVWYPDKLKRATNCLSKYDQTIPLLWCSTTRLIDENEAFLGNAKVFKKPPSFQNAIIQSIAAGCTMVFNQSTRALLKKAGTVNVVSHDWWTYQVVTGCGGICIYDTSPSIHYRQHGNNVIGNSSGIINSCKRIKMLFQGRFRKWNDRNILSLHKINESLTSDARFIINNFEKLRADSLFLRISTLVELKLYRHTVLQQLALYLACIFKKL